MNEEVFHPTDIFSFINSFLMSVYPNNNDTDVKMSNVNDNSNNDDKKVLTEEEHNKKLEEDLLISRLFYSNFNSNSNLLEELCMKLINIPNLFPKAETIMTMCKTYHQMEVLYPVFIPLAFQALATKHANRDFIIYFLSRMDKFVYYAEYDPCHYHEIVYPLLIEAGALIRDDSIAFNIISKYMSKLSNYNIKNNVLLLSFKQKYDILISIFKYNPRDMMLWIDVIKSFMDNQGGFEWAQPSNKRKYIPEEEIQINDFIQIEMKNYIHTLLYNNIPLKDINSIPTETLVFMKNDLIDFANVNFNKLKKNFPDLCREISNLHVPILQKIVDFLMNHMKLNSLIHRTILIQSDEQLNNYLYSYNNEDDPHRHFQHLELFFKGLYNREIIKLSGYIQNLYTLKPNVMRIWINKNGIFINLYLLSELINMHGDGYLLDIIKPDMKLWDTISEIALIYKDPFRVKEVNANNIDQLSVIIPKNSDTLPASIKVLLHFTQFFKKKFDIQISFKDEMGKGKGVLYSWFSRIISKLIDPEISLFYLEENSEIYNLADLTEVKYNFLQCDKKELFRFLGIFFSLILHYNIQTGVCFSSYFINKLVDFYDTSHNDYRVQFAMELDAEFTKGLLKLKDKDSWETMKEMYPECKNAQDAIDQQLDTRFHFIASDEDSLLKDSFELLTSDLQCGYILPHVLQSKLQGSIKKINIDEWKSHIIINQTDAENIGAFLWEWLEDSTKEQNQQFLKFITCRPVVSNLGLSKLDPRITVTVNYTIDSNQLPTSQTCFHTIRFPKYTSYELFKSKLDQALEFSKVENISLE